jgi:hypothetical protein
MIKRERTCKHCAAQFTANRHDAKYCSSACKASAARLSKSKQTQKKIERRKTKLPTSTVWLWIARNCKKAGTVEILQDVDLKELIDLYAYAQKAKGYNSEEDTPAKFHLCHIAPVNDKNSSSPKVGLLHHQNLFVGSASKNAQHQNNYFGGGVSIRRFALKREWFVSDTDTDSKVLDKVVKYLGPKLTDYLKDNAVKKSNRFSVIERIAKHPDNNTSLSSLKKMKLKELMYLDADLHGKEVHKVNKPSKRSLLVYHRELERFASYSPSNKDDLLFVSDAVRLVCQYLAQRNTYASNMFGSDFDEIVAAQHRMYSEFSPLALKEGKDVSKLRDFISSVAFETLQGKSVDRPLIQNTLHSYLKLVTLSPVDDTSIVNTWDFSWIQEEHDQYRANIPLVIAAINSLQFSMDDPVVLGVIDDAPFDIDYLISMDCMSNNYDMSLPF